jgi:hypothetical protein
VGTPVASVRVVIESARARRFAGPSGRPDRRPWSGECWRFLFLIVSHCDPFTGGKGRSSSNSQAGLGHLQGKVEMQTTRLQSL